MKNYFAPLVMSFLSYYGLPVYACQVPSTLNGISLLQIADSNYLPSNPYAGAVFKMEYLDNNFTNTMLASREKYDGTYTYEIFDNGMGFIQAEENFSDDITAVYSMTLVCENDVAGTYVYNQQRGSESESRTNTGRYIILQ